jgi:TetR/AcrR family transcriptional regulator, transcriptional repressor for nem operon
LPATNKGRLTRERIVRAAAELVGETGAAGVSLDDVQARAGVSRSQLYHHFDDRDDLIRGVIGATAGSVLGAQGELLDHLDTWAGVDRWFDALVAIQVERQAQGGCALGSLAGQLAERDPAARRAIADGLDGWEGRLREGLERMKARRVLRPGADPVALATATMSSLQGGLLLTQVRRDPQQLRIALDAARTRPALGETIEMTAPRACPTARLGYVRRMLAISLRRSLVSRPETSADKRGEL